jgi:hypothetical protein
MRILVLLLSVATLLAACAPAASPEPTAIPTSIPPTAIPPSPVPPTKRPSPTVAPTAVEFPAASADDLAGIWWFSTVPLKVEFRADGTYRIFTSMSEWSGDEAQGTFTLEQGRLTLVTSEPLCAVLPAPTYEAYLTKQDGKPAWLRLLDTGKDACPMRSIAFARPGKFLEH